MRLFLDANILFSAAKSDGAIRELLRRLLDDGHECWVDEYVVIEARRNLHLKGPAAIEAFERLLTRIRVCPLQAISPPRAEFDWLPEKDRPVLAAAIRTRCEALVTGDRTHFGAGYGKTFGGVTVYSPRGLAEAIFGKR
jgi:uncharacterized protein